MTDEFMLTKRYVRCDACGGEIIIPIMANSGVLQCKFCGALYEYNPTIRLVPKLILEEDEKHACQFALTNNTLIGREGITGYVTLRNEMDEFFKQDTHIRNPFVSRQPHVKITVKEEFSFFSKGDLKNVIAKKKCFIEDCGSTNGTSINDCMLKPHEIRELKHDDRITLAPLSVLPLTIIFRELVRNT